MTADRVSVTSQRDNMTSHVTKKADIMTSCLQVLVYVCCSVEMSPVKRSPDALSLAEGNAEPIQALNGFYGNPIYR